LTAAKGHDREFTKRLDKMWDFMNHMMQQKMFSGYDAGKPPDGWESESRRTPAPGAAPQHAPPPVLHTRRHKGDGS